MKQLKPQNQSVVRAIKILEFLAVADGPLELKTISKTIRMNKSTVYRFLATLIEAGYVHQDISTGKYSLGSKVTWLAANYLDRTEIRSLAQPFLRELANLTGETIHLAILDRDEVSYLEKIDGNQAVRMASRVGGRAPAHCTALGRVLLASRPEIEWKNYVTKVGLKPRTSKTILESEKFFDDLRRVRGEGYAIDNEEAEDWIRCVAAPITDSGGNVVAAVSVTGWTLTMTIERVMNLVNDVKKTAFSISKQLG
jgi:IclR family KDG regulon transcriptional repressor